MNAARKLKDSEKDHEQSIAFIPYLYLSELGGEEIRYWITSFKYLLENPDITEQEPGILSCIRGELSTIIPLDMAPLSFNEVTNALDILSSLTGKENLIDKSSELFSLLNSKEYLLNSVVNLSPLELEKTLLLLTQTIFRLTDNRKENSTEEWRLVIKYLSLLRTEMESLLERSS